MFLKVKVLNENGTIPKYSSKGAAGMDICSAEDILILPYSISNEVYHVKTGIAFELDTPGFEIQIRQRSGLSISFPNYLANSPGTIDYDYRGEVGLLIVNNTNEPWMILKGERIAQAVVSPVKQCGIVSVETMGDTERGADGFGSTGI